MTREGEADALRVALQQLPAAVWTTDLELRFLASAGAALDRLGLRPGQLVGKTLYDYFGTSDPAFPPIAAHLRAASGESQTFDFEWPSGQFWRTTVDPLHDESGRIVGTVGVTSDVTELMRAHQSLRETEGRFQQLVHAIREVFWLVEWPSGRPLYVSPAFQAVYGRPAQDLYDNPGLFPQLIHPDDRDRLAQGLMSTLKARGMQGMEIEYRVVHPDGSVRWVRDRSFPVVGEEGQVTRLAGIAEDITESRRMEEHVRHTQKMEALGRMAGGIAHDFNNALTAILGYADELRRRLVDGENATMAGYIVEAAEKSAALTRQLLTFSHKRRVDRRAVNVNQLVVGLTPLVTRLLGAKVELRTRLASGLATVQAEPTQLEQVIMNLVMNARDAIGSEGTITIETSDEHLATPDPVSGLPAGDFVRLRVRDTGAGIAPDVQTRMFEPFFTTKPPGQGTGLGLSIVHGVVQQHGGQIQVESEPGRGASFTIRLPAFTPAQESVGPPTATARSRRGTETVLLVDDEPAVRDLVTRQLLQHGYLVLPAADGEEALALLRVRGAQVDLLLTDLVMPRLGGLELIAKAHELLPALRVLCMSGYPGPDETAAAERVGPFIEKPFTMEALLEKVRAALDAVPRLDR